MDKAVCYYKLNYRLLAVLIIAVFLSILGDRFKVDELKYLGCVIVLIYLFNKKQSDFAKATVFLIYAGDLLQLAGISITSILTFVIVGRIFLTSKTCNEKFFKASIVLMGYGIWHILNRDFYTVFLLIKTIVLLYFIWICVLKPNVSCARVYDLLQYMIIGCIITILFSWMFNFYLLNGLRWGISEATGINNTAILTGITFTICLLMVMRCRGNKKIFWLGLIISGSACGLTGSRTGFLLIGCSLLWIFVYIFLYGDMNKKLKIVLLAVCLISLGIAVFAMSESIRNTIFYMLSKTLEPKNGDISNGRFELWGEYLKRWKDNILWIILGCGTYTNMGMDTMAHNMIIEQLVQFGLIGNGILIYLYYIIYKKMDLLWKDKRNKKSHPYTRIIVINILIAGMLSHVFIGLNNTMLFWIGIILGQFFIHQREVEKYIRI